MGADFTRRSALAGGAGLALARVLEGPARAFAKSGVDHFSAPVALPSGDASASGAGWTTAKPQRAPRTFHVIGARWKDAGHHLHVQVRVRQHSRWSRWLDLPAGGDHGPDGRGATRGTDPAWVGATRDFQFRTKGRIAGLRAHMVHSAPRAIPAAAASSAKDRDARAAGQPAIISRAAWGAAPPTASPAYGEIQMAYVHHTVSLNDYTRDESASIVKGIQRYHQASNGWNDIGYNFLVDRYGQVFEGRAGGIDKAVIGAQAGGWNSVSTGVAAIGTFESEQVPAATFDAIAATVGWKLALHGVPTQGTVVLRSISNPASRYPGGQNVTFQRISGHRDGCTTDCPGNALYAQLPALRAKAGGTARRAGLGIALPKARVAVNARARVRGRLTTPDGSAPAGVRVLVQALYPEGWRTLTGAVTDAAGNWTTIVRLPYTRSLRAITDGATPYAPITSPRVKLEVNAKVTAKLAPNRVRFGRRTRLSGSVQPAQKRQTLTVTVERQASSGRWQRVLRVPVTARNGRFSARLPLLRRGRIRVTVSTARTRLSAAGASRRLPLRVR